MRASSRKALVLAAVLSSACAPRIEDTVLPPRIDYVCGGNRVLPVERIDGRQAAVLVDGKRFDLKRTESAAQEKYSDGRLSLYLDGERAMLERDGIVLFGPCDSPVTLPTAPRYR
jgi:membrane-bound inhibitor of C-type lysozyme